MQLTEEFIWVYSFRRISSVLDGKEQGRAAEAGSIGCKPGMVRSFETSKPAPQTALTTSWRPGSQMSEAARTSSEEDSHH